MIGQFTQIGLKVKATSLYIKYLLYTGQWHCVKRTLPECGRYDLQSYLPVYLWKQAMAKEGKDCFDEILKLLKKHPTVLEEDDETEVYTISELFHTKLLF